MLNYDDICSLHRIVKVPFCKDSDLRGSTMDKKKFFSVCLIWLSVYGVLLVKMANNIPRLLGICLE